MKLGFIGTGRITSAVVTGICSSNISYKDIGGNGMALIIFALTLIDFLS